MERVWGETENDDKRKREVYRKMKIPNGTFMVDIYDVSTSSPSAGLSGDVEEAVGEDEEEVEDGDEGEVTPPGLTSASFFSFRSTCLLFVPGQKERK